MKNNYTYANNTFSIETKYPYFHLFSKDYQSNEVPEYEITISEEDIQYEINHAGEGNFKEDYLETLAVYRKVTECLLNKDILLIHGSCVEIDDKAYLFCAKSGVGKSTHTALIKKVLKDRVKYINDDKPLVEIKDDYVKVYGTPWNGKHNLSNNTSAKLAAVVFVNRGITNVIKEIDYDEAFIPLFKQVHMPDKVKVLSIINKMKKLKFYHLECNMDDEAAIISTKGIIHET